MSRWKYGLVFLVALVVGWFGHSFLVVLSVHNDPDEWREIIDQAEIRVAQQRQ